MFYIYLVALYFLYTNQHTVNRHTREGTNEHPLHDHVDLPTGFDSMEAVWEFRQQRYQKALDRPADLQGPGEDGTAVVLTPEEQAQADRLFEKETFNVIASNKMAMDRRVKDIRHPEYVLWQFIYDFYMYTYLHIEFEKVDGWTFKTWLYTP